MCPPRELHPLPKSVQWHDGLLILRERTTLAVSPAFESAILALFRQTWGQFTHNSLALEIRTNPSLRDHQFSITSVSATGATLPSLRPRLPEKTPASATALTGEQAPPVHILHVSGDGIAASATGTAAARHAWFTLLQLLQPSRHAGEYSLPHVEIHDWPDIGFRGLHLCVFPETTELALEKAIRLAALLKFTHLTIEFWGMLKFDALRELSWPHAWDKQRASRLFDIARGFGLEIIPMFNGWGHAPASRVAMGRHVVLDQNPALAPLFEPDGWTWCVSNPESQKILRAVYDELIELAGPGRYFIIGCDEAYSHATCDSCRRHDPVELFTGHINSLAKFVQSRGRRPIMWGDALLERARWPVPYEANACPVLSTHESLPHLSRDIVIADWHYGVTTGEIATLAHFREQGFDVLGCPWGMSRANSLLTANAAIKQSGGFLSTTWNSIEECIPQLIITATHAWNAGNLPATVTPERLSIPECGWPHNLGWPLARTVSASLLRKLIPAGGDYHRAGWTRCELEPRSV